MLTVSNLTKSFTAPEGGRVEIVRVPQFALAAGEQRALRGEAPGKGEVIAVHAGDQRAAGDREALRERASDAGRALRGAAGDAHDPRIVCRHGGGDGRRAVARPVVDGDELVVGAEVGQRACQRVGQRRRDVAIREEHRDHRPPPV